MSLSENTIIQNGVDLFDSDMTNTKETSSDKAEMKNHGRGMQFLKFGATKSGMWQPCDAWEGFKTMEAAC
jgi:hypothetical protein